MEINVRHDFHPIDDLGINPFVGPFVACNFGFKKPDYGLRFGCGVNYKQVGLNFGVYWGMKDNLFCNKDGYYENDANLFSFFVTLGLDFCGNRYNS